MALKRFLQRFASPGRNPLIAAGIDPGMYHYRRESEGESTRFHLRVDSTGQGLLVANAASAARLRPSGVIIAKGLLDGDDDQTILAALERSFRRLPAKQIGADLARVRGIIRTLDSPGDNYPIINLSDPSFSADSAPPDKPLSADVPLGRSRQMLPILDRLWESGIPHVTVIAGEKPEAEDLVRAVRRAEDLGMIAGVRARGSDLLAGALIEDLAVAGVDHLDVLYLSAAAEIHNALAGGADHQKAVQAIAQIRAAEVCPVAEVALTKTTLGVLDETLEALAAAGVRNACFFALLATAETPLQELQEALSEEQLLEASEIVEEAAAESDVRYLWYPPLPVNPVSSLGKQVRRGPRCSGEFAVRVEHDGSVIPPWGPWKPVENLFHGDW
jgi:MoaA/NifB/PqqE/SkfB family radical SAM enzyme